MKTINFIRHAKSSWTNNSLSDHDRPLNNRGKRDAPYMATILKEKGGTPDLMICSTAKRAHLTAIAFTKEFGLKQGDIMVMESIYEAEEQTILDILLGLDDSYSEVCIFGHNPTFTSLVNLYSKTYLLNLPTCGIARVVAEVDAWADFSPKKGTVTELLFPKHYFA